MGGEGDWEDWEVGGEGDWEDWEVGGDWEDWGAGLGWELSTLRQSWGDRWMRS